MFGRRRREEIDAAAEFDRRDEERLVDGERGRADLGAPRGRPAGARPFLLLTGAVALGVAGIVTAQALGGREDAAEETSKAQAVVRNLNPGFKPAAVEPPSSPAPLADDPLAELPQDPPPPMPLEPASGRMVPALTEAPGGGGVAKERELSPAEKLHRRRLSGDLGHEQMRPARQNEPPPVTMEARADGEGELQRALRPMRLNAQAAGMLEGRDYLLTQGAMLDCVLETKIVSSVAGMTACHLTRDVYSTNGRVVLLDKGSKVIGAYEGGMRRGQRRLFVKWTRVETPKGVVINLDSPGTGALGEAGVDGWIDTHFGERFGGAVMLSLVGDLGDYFANQNSGGRIQLDNSQSAAEQMARTTLENSINIPPTLYKNQGERIAIFVARDLDFRGVYDLARR